MAWFGRIALVGRQRSEEQEVCGGAAEARWVGGEAAVGPLVGFARLNWRSCCKSEWEMELGLVLMGNIVRSR